MLKVPIIPNALFLIILFVSFTACKEKKTADRIADQKEAFPNDIGLSDKAGWPKDSFAFYFAPEKFIDTARLIYFYVNGGLEIRGAAVSSKEFLSREHKIPVSDIKDSMDIYIDSTRLMVLSYYLYKLHEPMLNNFYLGKDIIRLMLIPGISGRHYAISVIKDVDSCYATVRVLRDQIKHPFGDTYVYHDSTGKFEKLKNEGAVNPLITDKTTRLSEQEFQEIDSIARLLNMSEHPYFEKCHVVDGAFLLIEVHKKDGHRFTERCDLSPGTPIRSLLDRMVELCKLNEHGLY